MLKPSMANFPATFEVLLQRTCAATTPGDVLLVVSEAFAPLAQRGIFCFETSKGASKYVQGDTVTAMADTRQIRAEGLECPGESALLGPLISLAGPKGSLGEQEALWLTVATSYARTALAAMFHSRARDSATGLPGGAMFGQEVVRISEASPSLGVLTLSLEGVRDEGLGLLEVIGKVCAGTIFFALSPAGTYGLLMPGVSRDVLIAHAGEIRERAECHFIVEGLTTARVSIGVAYGPDDGPGEDLLDGVKAASEKARAMVGNRICAVVSPNAPPPSSPAPSGGGPGGPGPGRPAPTLGTPPRGTAPGRPPNAH